MSAGGGLPRSEYTMPLIEWDESFCVHDAVIDEHHWQLVQLLNRTFDDFRNGVAEQSLGAVIQDLLNYATFHFAVEERSMAEDAYPELEDHREEHARFVLKVARLQKSFQEGDKNLCFETISFLKNWITQHIRENDARYGDFIARKR